MKDEQSASSDLIRVEVAYATPTEQVVIPLMVPVGSCLRDVIEASKILERFPAIDLDKQAVGVFSQLRKLDDVVQNDDRVEIYRDLVADPKEVRRRRAAEQRQQGRVR